MDGVKAVLGSDQSPTCRSPSSGHRRTFAQWAEGRADAVDEGVWVLPGTEVAALHVGVDADGIEPAARGPVFERSDPLFGGMDARRVGIAAEEGEAGRGLDDGHAVVGWLPR